MLLDTRMLPWRKQTVLERSPYHNAYVTVFVVGMETVFVAHELRVGFCYPETGTRG